MAKFYTGKELTDFIYDIIWNAENQLLIVSPFIKLDEYFKEMFENHKHRHNLQIIIVFGKNEAAPNKSLGVNDFDFFKQFKNIAIVYCADLHAKYYGNEKTGVITSINLYDKSFEKNIEYGVGHEFELIDNFQTGVDKQAWQYSMALADKNPLVYLKRPVYESGLLSSLTGKKNYIDTKVLYDATELISNRYLWGKEGKKYLSEFPESVDISNHKKDRPAKAETPVSRINAISASNKTESGYCIRTGVPIPFNLEKPMCYEAYKTWSRYSNPDFKENFCHKTGKPSYGKTSMRKPIMM